jgi:uncharacterized repeat protein (TIGR01451 family)
MEICKEDQMKELTRYRKTALSLALLGLLSSSVWLGVSPRQSFAGPLPPSGADLAVTKTAPASASKSAADGTFSYGVTVRNLGPMEAASVTATDTLPAGVSLISAVPSRNAPCVLDAAANTVNCHLGLMSAGERVTIAIKVRINSETDAGATLVGRATVSHEGEADPQPRNNTSRTSTVVTP